MVVVTRNKTRLERDCIRKGFHHSEIATEKMIDIAIRSIRRQLARLGLTDDNAFAARWLPDIAVPAERALASGLAPNTIDSMNSVIRAMKSVVYNHCLMAGGYPTYLLGRTTKFSDVDFVLLIHEEVDYYSFYINFVKLVEEQLDPDKNWKFEVYCHMQFPDVPLSEKTSISFVTIGTEIKEEGYPGGMDMEVVKLKTDNVNVADICFFVQSNATLEKLTLSTESVIDSLLQVGEAGYEYEKAIDTIIYSYDSYLVMNIARFDGHGRLHCCDVSGEDDIDKVDKRYLQIFKEKGSKRRSLKYSERISMSFTRYVKELRGLQF